MRVLVLGGASYDDIIHLDEFIEPIAKTVFPKVSYSTPGSTGLGKALAFKKLGYVVDFVAVIGKDYFGQIIEDTLSDAGVKFYPIYRHITERHTNIHNKMGERISIFTSIPEYNEINPNDFEDLIVKADIVSLNIKSYCKAFIPLLKKHSKPIYCDIHDYDGIEEYHKDFINNSDFILMSSDRMNSYQELMKKFLKEGKKWVVCTHANKGSSVLTDEEFVSIPGSNIKIVDTNGAGDNFFVGFVHGYLNDYSIKDCLQLGKIVAETCIKSKEIVSKDLSLEYLNKIFLETV